MNTSAEMAIKVIDAIRHFDGDIHIVIREKHKGIDSYGDIAIIPTNNDNDIETRKVSMDSIKCIPIKEFFNDIRCVNAGITTLSDSDERKMYFGSGRPTVIGSVDWAYSSPLEDLSRLKNFCKVCFNTTDFIYVLFVDNISDQQDIIDKIKILTG